MKTSIGLKLDPKLAYYLQVSHLSQSYHIISYYNYSIYHVYSKTSIWNAWLGFNMSHSIGLILFGVYNYILLNKTDFKENNQFFYPTVIGISSLFTVISKKHWFILPTVGFSVATLGFIASYCLDKV